jgi:hypothetical protein
LVRITNGETSDLPSESPPLIDVTSSPSRDRLAFIALGEEGAYSVALLNPDGTTSIVAPLLDDWVALASWINNTTLLVRKSAAANGSLPPSVVLLDTPTGAYREIELDFPGFYAPAADENLWHTSAFIDPSVSRVAYVALGEGDFEIRLWDLQEAKVIGELSPWNSAFGSPAWSSEGDRLFIPSYVSSELGDPREDFYSLSFEGESSRVTHLSEGASAADIGTFEISPHGDQLAFWLRGAAAEHETLHVLIPGAPEEITDLCILGNQDDSMSRPPIWSPSGREVLVTTTLPGGGLTSVVLIDLERDIAAVVAQNMEAVSWIGEP